ncbi:2-alkenal reductase (NADP(+)) [Ranunculus cassubicifolius]
MAAEVVSNKQIILPKFINGGLPKESDLVVETSSIALKLPEGSKAVLVKNLYFSCDPYMRSQLEKIEDLEAEVQSFIPGAPIYSVTVGKVLESGNPDFSTGDIVWGMCPWQEYSIIEPPHHTLWKAAFTDIPLSYYTGILGIIGLTAWAGLHEIGAPKEGEKVYVSAASGAVGQLVGQFAKIAGCYVVGSAGSAEKVELLKTKFGYDEAFNYREEKDLGAALAKYFPSGIDVYFDGVGGKMLDAVLLNMNLHGRIVAAGMISQYNLKEHEGVKNLWNLVTKRVRMEGFSAFQFFHLFPKFTELAYKYIKEGKLVYVEDTTEGIENAPAALVGIFRGQNVGKKIVRIASE